LTKRFAFGTKNAERLRFNLELLAISGQRSAGHGEFLAGRPLAADCCAPAFAKTDDMSKNGSCQRSALAVSQTAGIWFG
jgi:hypothetical protein